MVPWTELGTEPDSEALGTSSLPRVELVFPEEASSMEPGSSNEKRLENE